MVQHFKNIGAVTALLLFVSHFLWAQIVVAQTANEEAPANNFVVDFVAPTKIQTEVQTQMPANQTGTVSTPAIQSTTSDSTNAPALENNAQGMKGAPPINASTIGHDLSPWGMFMAADWVVKTVMIGLALASVATWTIFIVKTLELSNAKRKARASLQSVYNAKSLTQLVEQMQIAKGMGPILVKAAQNEVQASIKVIDIAGSEGLKERVSSLLSRLITASGREISFGTGILATIGAIGPFVGLFGTVWGIMNSFIGISKSQTTNLAVVAPGIAEALLATAIGLVAAVPAVIIYNVFARSITGYRQQLVDVSAGIERLVSRDLDFRKSQQHVKNISAHNVKHGAVNIGDDLAIAAE